MPRCRYSLMVCVSGPSAVSTNTRGASVWARAGMPASSAKARSAVQVNSSIRAKGLDGEFILDLLYRLLVNLTLEGD